MTETGAAIVAENSEEWERLLRLLRITQARIFWIYCDTDLVWLHLIPALKDALPDYGHAELRVDEKTESLYHAAVAAVDEDADPSIIHVLGMGAAVESGLFLRNLNMGREILFRKAPGHLIIWGTQAAATIISNRTADWWSWLAFTFYIHTPEALLNARQRGFNTEMQLGDRVLSVESRDGKERIRHLEQEWKNFCESIDSTPITARLAEELVDLALALGREYRDAGKYSLAASILREVSERCVGFLSEMKRSILMNDEGLNLQSLGKYEQAEKLLRQSLAIVEHGFANNFPGLAMRLNNLALLFLETDRPSEAEPLLRRTLDIGEQYLGKDHPDVAVQLSNLASLLYDTNRFLEAELLIRRALEIDEINHRKDHPDNAVRLNNLASILQATNRLSEAELIMRKALEIDEQTLGKNHPNNATVLNNLALLLQDTNRLLEAEPLMRRAALILFRNLGDEYPDTKQALDNYRRLLQVQGKSEPEIEAAIASLPDDPA